MRVVIQRVSEASVTIEGSVTGEIGTGLLILLGVEERDGPEDVEWLAPKICRMRIFPDEASHMNRSLLDVDGGALVISQFTLHARCKKGTRPSFDKAAKPEQAIPLYEAFIAEMEKLLGKPVASGEFGAYCQPCPRSMRVDGEPAPPPRRKKATGGDTHWPAWPDQHASRGRVA